VYYRNFYDGGFKPARRKAPLVRAATVLTVAVVSTICVARIYFAPAAPKLVDDASYTQNQYRERVGLRQTSSAREGQSEATELTSPPLRLPFEPRVATGSDVEFVSKDLSRSLRYPDEQWRNVPIGGGDNLSLIFARVGATNSSLQKVLNSDGSARKALMQMQPNQIVRFRFEKNELVELIYEKDFLNSLRWIQKGATYKVETLQTKPEVRVASAVAEINHSLFIDGQKAGLSDRTIAEFINIFGWDVDFLRDLQRGDRFSVVFEEFYKDGQKFGNGKILAAEFVNNGKKLRALYFEDDKGGNTGYFSAKGEPMRKTFLRTPVNFTRISSRFSLARRHPILNRIRAHKGVDYSAPMGTPIQAVADGDVEFAGWQNGYGRVVVLKHGNSYSTLYGHMSGFASKIRTGERVNQGQTIGFVGKTGLATGPHLHYEFRVNGENRDPLAIKSLNLFAPDAKFQRNFRSKTASMLARLDALKPETVEHGNSMVAGAEPERESTPIAN
jgi:murein DD-endopeptidase MepM/ murein hydrolase activator NlpD